MLSLLTPAFLAGLAALAIPLLVHLIRRERHDAVEFPSLMFISRIPQRTIRRRRIRNWWLFALRCLALILLVGAFARPFVDRPADPLAGATPAREVVILLDRSYSMGYGDRWDRAVAAAGEAIDGLGPNDRATLVLFDAGAQVAAAATAERARLRDALGAARVGAHVTRYTPALKLAQSILAGSELPRREAVLISDFQRSGWDGAAGAQLPAGAELRPVLIGGEDVANLIVTGVTLERVRVAGRERVTPTAHFANRAAGAASGVAVTVEAAGRALQSERVTVPANATASLQLQPITVGDAPIRVSVRTGGDALPADDAFHFVLTPAPGLRVLIVEASSRDASLYVRRSLELAQEPPFDVRVKRDGMPTAAELERTDVVLLNDVLPPQGEAGRRLLAWVGAGGGVVLALGERTAATPWSDAAREIAGGVPERITDRVDGGGGRLGYLDYSHPVFEPFRAPRAGAFSALRFYRYRALPSADARPASSDSGTALASVIARFDDGGAALVERGIGAGRALVWGSTLDAFWTNAPLEPVFLPLVHQVVKRAAGFSPAPAWSGIGQVVDVGAGTGTPLLVTTPGGGRIEVAADHTLLTLDEQGFYDVREARAGSTTLRTIAANVDVTESELTPLDPTEVAAAVTIPAGGAREAAAATLPRAEQERRQSLWWYLLFTAFALLTVETVLANRRSRRTA
jgi:hypothetical protein